MFKCFQDRVGEIISFPKESTSLGSWKSFLSNTPFKKAFILYTKLFSSVYSNPTKKLTQYTPGQKSSPHPLLFFLCWHILYQICYRLDVRSAYFTRIIHFVTLIDNKLDAKYSNIEKKEGGNFCPGMYSVSYRNGETLSNYVYLPKKTAKNAKSAF